MGWQKITGGVVPIEVSSKWTGKRVNFLGDSITDPNQNHTTTYYYDFLNTEKQFSVVRKYGVSGSSLSNASGDCFVTRYPAMDSGADLVVVFGGINDYYSNRAPLGTFTDRGASTLYGACHSLMEGLITKYINGKLVFMTPIPHPTGDTANSHGITLKKVADVIKEVASYYGIPVLDLYTIGGLQTKVTIVKDTFVPDGIHPNGAGHRIIADKLGAFIETI